MGQRNTGRRIADGANLNLRKRDGFVQMEGYVCNPPPRDKISHRVAVAPALSMDAVCELFALLVRAAAVELVIFQRGHVGFSGDEVFKLLRRFIGYRQNTKRTLFDGSLAI